MAAGLEAFALGNGNVASPANFNGNLWTPVIGTGPYHPAPMLLGPDGNPMSATNPIPTYSAGGLVQIAATQFTRPANTTTYTAGDLVADTTTAGSIACMAFPNAVRAAGASIRVERFRLRRSGVSLATASFRAYLCTALPTFSVGDNGVLNVAGVLAINDVSLVRGWFDLVMDRAGAAGAMGVGVPNVGSSITLTPASGTTLYAVIETTGGFTPLSGETFDGIIEGGW